MSSTQKDNKFINLKETALKRRNLSNGGDSLMGSLKKENKIDNMVNKCIERSENILSNLGIKLYNLLIIIKGLKKLNMSNSKLIVSRNMDSSFSKNYEDGLSFTNKSFN